MVPKELKTDKDGLLYTDDKKLFIWRPLLIDQRELDLDNRYRVNGFYQIIGTDDYILKHFDTTLTRDESKYFKEMLQKFKEKKDDIHKTDLPIGYFLDHRKVAGLIIKYYQNAMTLENIVYKDINELNNYYCHDEDTIHNLFLLLNEILENIQELYDCGIYYVDINSSNFVLTNNDLKIIDFDIMSIKLDNKDKRLLEIMRFYQSLVRFVLNKYNLMDYVNESLLSFEEAKRFVKKLENNVRK